MKSRFILIINILLIFFISTPLSIAGSYKIESPSEKQLSLVKVLLNQDVVINRSAVIKSLNHKKSYYLGLNFTVSGIKKAQTGVWIISGDRVDPKMVLAVDGFAQNFSRALPANKTKPPTAYSYDAECKVLKKHLK